MHQILFWQFPTHKIYVTIRGKLSEPQLDVWLFWLFWLFGCMPKCSSFKGQKTSEQIAFVNLRFLYAAVPLYWLLEERKKEYVYTRISEMFQIIFSYIYIFFLYLIFIFFCWKLHISKTGKAESCPAPPVPRTGDPPWILKQGGQEISGGKLISSNGKTKIKAFFIANFKVK